MTARVDTAKSQVLAASDRKLVATAAWLIPALRSRSSETDTLARLPDFTIAELEKAQLFDMLVPNMYGGDALSEAHRRRNIFRREAGALVSR